ncbi:MAG: MotA/TolQ/ExbB proton channel family protein [Bdellovibrionales bacterium]|nr:MotA/TolQ/ExbB proton channel family protein [Bdellovibrionales bacterium]NQZ19250.1 MotA/TolQ/ExbB proton channel family protein [Bdellovibrionales bacterium]
MKRFNLLISTLLLIPSLAFAANLDELLQKVQQESVTQSKEYKEREAEFMREKNKQKALLRKAQAELTALEKETARLMVKFDANEKVLTKLEDELTIAMGTLGEMFGVVKQVAGDLKGQVEASVVSAQIKGRKAFAADLAESKSLPNIPKLEKLWYELQREMTETGKTTQFSATVVKPDGEKVEQKVTRVGAFNLVSDGVYLNYQPSTGQIVELGRQPSGRFTGTIDDVEEAKEGYEAFALDPSRGSLLSMLVRAPSLWERLQQGGLVGYVIIMLLFVGIGLVIERVKTLKTEGDKIKAQMGNTTPSDDNALGKIMLAFESNKTTDLETLELKMDEAILKSTPPLEKGIGTIKILAAVAPLLGLLGTVTGMIATFQSITLFGTGDPKLMAGGISQALITTVLGLVCAIPLLLLHNLVATRSKGLVQILEEQSAGMIATRAEKAGK